MSLNELIITNLIFIDTLHLEFSSGLNIITGETGAGKSLLLGALSLVLGQKVSPSSYIRKGASQATVTAIFMTPASDKLTQCLEHAGLNCTEELILRRTLYRTNTGKCWINDQPVTLQTLQAIGEHLVDIHGQNQHQVFLKKHIHLQLLDILGEHDDIMLSYRNTYRTLKVLENKLEELNQNQESRVQELEMLRFQESEISRHNLEPGRDEQLESERNLLKNAHELKGQAEELMELLYQSESSVFSLLSRARSLMDTFARGTSKFHFQENFHTILSLTEEIFRDINETEQNIEINPQRLNEIEEELNQLYHLKRKYGSSLEEIIAYQTKIQNKIEKLSQMENEEGNIQEELKNNLLLLEKTADTLSHKRKILASQLEQAVNRELQFLAFSHPHFSIQIEELQKPGPNGKDNVEFFISTNPDRKPQPLREVASGGEISRIMLALKTVFARADQIPSMVFDEIDTGIGSITAHKVGQALKKLTDNHQVICISHLPQIAIKADCHLVVEKTFEEGRTIIQVRKLEGKQEQEQEITRLLGLESTEKKARQIARKLLDEFHSNPEK